MQTTYSATESSQFAKEQCALVYALEIIQGKWKLPILWFLANEGPLRYGEPQQRLGEVTHTSLSRALRELEDFELLHRIVFDEQPPHTEYELTESARTLYAALETIYDWGFDQLQRQGGCPENWPEQADRLP